MSSPLRKIQKNSETFKNSQMFGITYEEYSKRMQIVKRQCEEDYNNKLMRMASEYDRQLAINTESSINTISVELLYELATQMGCFEKNPEYLDEKIDKVQEIYENTMESIKKYNKYKRPSKEFAKRKNKVEKLFKIIF